MKELILGWLLARGVALPNEASDQKIITELQTAFDQPVKRVAALGNDKSTLDARITALENERNQATALAATRATALENEQTARKTERTGRATVATDLLIQSGRLTPAQRDATITSLANASDFEATYKPLAEAARVVKTTVDAVSGKQDAALANEAQALQNEYQQAFKTELIAAGQDPVKAHRAIMTLPKYSGLAAKFAPK